MTRDQEGIILEVIYTGLLCLVMGLKCQANQSDSASNQCLIKSVSNGCLLIFRHFLAILGLTAHRP